MPIYEYRCTSCHHRFELRQSFNDPATAHCPHCQGLGQRIIHPAGVVFKGRGWYSTDHRSTSTFGGDGGRSSEDQGSGEAPAAETAAAPTEGKGEE